MADFGYILKNLNFGFVDFYKLRNEILVLSLHTLSITATLLGGLGSG